MPNVSTGITLLGLGPGDSAQLTRQAWQILSNAQEVYLRTDQHPAVNDFPGQLKIHAFDYLYQDMNDSEAVYRAIVEQVISLGSRAQGVIYAVPGHPFIAESTGPEIARRARQQGIPLTVIHGLSFLEPVCAALGQDPFPHTALVDAMELSLLHMPPFPTNVPAIITQIYDRHVASEVKLTLMALYPDQHPVVLVYAAGTPQERVEHLPLYQIDRSPHIGFLTALYLPPLAHQSAFEAFGEVVARLREPDGCPWDREQTHQSLRPYLLEETYEALTALDAEDPQALQEELGDILLQILLHAQIASEDGEFTIADVLQTVHTKIVRRHPHVFADVQVNGLDGVLQNWEKLKSAERAENGQHEKGALDGVALALPALAQAETYQKRAARVGFDWPEISGVWDKVFEEIEEIRSAPNKQEQAGEVGDLLFAVVNLARWLNIDPESALRQSNARFKSRFADVEQSARSQKRDLQSMTLAELGELWEDAKARQQLDED